MVGEEDGGLIGECVGSIDGYTVGLVDGARKVGFADGDVIGETVGFVDGATVGLVDGGSEGFEVGLLVGELIGLDTVAFVTGDLVGIRVGCLVSTAISTGSGSCGSLLITFSGSFTTNECVAASMQVVFPSVVITLKLQCDKVSQCLYGHSFNHSPQPTAPFEANLSNKCQCPRGKFPSTNHLGKLLVLSFLARQPLTHPC